MAKKKLPASRTQTESNVVYIKEAGWMSFSEGVPEDDGFYLVYGAGGPLGDIDWLDIYDLEEGKFEGSMQGIRNATPLFWLRIPMPPSLAV